MTIETKCAAAPAPNRIERRQKDFMALFDDAVESMGQSERVERQRSPPARRRSVLPYRHYIRARPKCLLGERAAGIFTFSCLPCARGNDKENGAPPRGKLPNSSKFAINQSVASGGARRPAGPQAVAACGGLEIWRRKRTRRLPPRRLTRLLNKPRKRTAEAGDGAGSAYGRARLRVKERRNRRPARARAPDARPKKDRRLSSAKAVQLFQNRQFGRARALLEKVAGGRQRGLESPRGRLSADLRRAVRARQAPAGDRGRAFTTMRCNSSTIRGSRKRKRT